jgi:electron transfer flavoprotein beta subunit
MLIAVLAKLVPDTWTEREIDTVTGLVVRRPTEAVVDEVSERALEVALAARDAGTGAEVVVVTMGPAFATEGIRRLLATGADRAVHLLDDVLAGSDIRFTADVLSAALRRIGADLVIAGDASTDGNGGMIPAAVAAALDVPVLGSLEGISVSNGEVVGQRRGDGVVERVSAELPAVISVTERNPAMRFAGLRGVMGAKKKPLEQWSVAELDVPRPAARSVIVDVRQRPERSTGHKEVASADSVARLVAHLRELGHLEGAR